MITVENKAALISEMERRLPGVKFGVGGRDQDHLYFRQVQLTFALTEYDEIEKVGDLFKDLISGRVKLDAPYDCTLIEWQLATWMEKMTIKIKAQMRDRDFQYSF